MAAQAGELGGDLFGRQHEVHEPGRHGAQGHAGVAGRFFVLGESQAAFRLDGPQSTSAIGGGSGEDDADGRAFAVFRQRNEEVIDGQMPPAVIVAFGQAQDAALDGHVGVGRDHVDAIGLDGHAAGDFVDRHFRGSRENLAERALVRRVHVLDQYERHAGVVWQRLEQGGEGFQAAGGSAYAGHGKRRARRRFGGLGGGAGSFLPDLRILLSGAGAH